MEISSTLSDSEIKPRPAGKKGALFYVVFTWGVAGVLLLFGRAIWRLAPLAWEPIADGSLSAMQIGLYAAWVVFNAYSEGYRAFQKAFCPRVVGRAYHVAQNPTLLQALLAPAYCLSLFHANRRGLTVAWIMLGVIALLVALLRITPQPWRGIIDGGVVVALVWGSVVMLIMASRALVSGPPRAKLNLPDIKSADGVQRADADTDAARYDGSIL
jgi:hypothetical protein